MEAEKKSVYKDNIVCFIDILGYKENVISIANRSEKDAIEQIEKMKRIAEIFNEKYTTNHDDTFNIKTKIFSDSIIIVPELINDIGWDSKTIFDLILTLALWQFSLINELQIFVRGGISIGKHHFEGDVLISQAYINAYTLEKDAIYPRIIMDDKFINFAKKYPDWEAVEKWIKKDFDGNYFIDYLQYLNEYNEILGHKEIVENQLREHWNNYRIKAKYFWVANYHNLIVEKKSSSKDALIDVDKIEKKL